MVAPRILTFNFHEPYLCLLSEIGLPIEVGLYESGHFQRTWHTQFRPVPPNITFIPETQWRPDLAQGKYDVVIAQNEDNAMDIAKAVLESKTPALVVLHNRRQYIETRFPSADPVHKSNFNQILEVLQRCFTPVFISDTKQRSYGMAGLVIPPGIDVDAYGGYRGDRAEVLRVGNVMRPRTVMFDVDFQEEVVAGFPNVLLGEDPTMPQARPSQSYEDLLNHFRSLRCYLHVTREAFEDGYNLAMLEAMACGMPVVSLANTTSPITDGHDGFASYDAAVLRERIEALLADPAFARLIGAEGRETIAARFPLDRFTTAWRNAIEYAIDSGPLSTGAEQRPAPADIVAEYVAGPVTTARYMERALRKRHRVMTAGFRFPEALLAEWGFPDWPPAYLGQEIDLPLDGTIEAINRRLPNGFTPSLYLWIDSGAKNVAPDLDRLGCLKACYLIDTHIAPELRIEIARHFDVVFLAQKGQIELFRQQGIENVHWLPLGCSPELHAIGPQDRSLDVAWIGRVADDHNDARRVTVETLREQFPNGYYGTAWPEDMARIYGRAKIVVNLPIADDLNMRVFEAMAAGALLISPAVTGMADLFTAGEHYVAYTNPADIPNLVATYLADNESRERIASAAQRLVLQRHTYDKRMDDLVSTVFGGGQGRFAEEGYYRHERPEVQAHIPPGTRRLLDVGCGAGAFGRALKRAGLPEVVGIEVVEKAANLARQHLDRVLMGSVESMELPFDDGYFDVITCNDVLEHLVNPDVALRRLTRVLKPGGVFIISIPNIRFAPILDMLAQGRWKYDDEGIMDRTHLRFYTGTDFRLLLEDAGLEVQTVAPLSSLDESALTPNEDGSLTIGRVVVKDITPQDLIEFRTYQWLGIAARPDDATLERAQEALVAQENERAYRLAKNAASGDQRERRLIMAKAAARLGRYEEAEALYRSLLDADPADLGAAAELGILLVATNRAAEAEAYLQKAVSIETPNDRAVAALALIHVGREEWEPAYNRFCQAIELNMQCESVVPHLIAVAEILERREELVDLLLRYVRFFPGRLSAVVPVSSMFIDIGRTDEAREILDNASVLAPENAELQALLARLP